MSRYAGHYWLLSRLLVWLQYSPCLTQDLFRETQRIGVPRQGLCVNCINFMLAVHSHGCSSVNSVGGLKFQGKTVPVLMSWDVIIVMAM